MGNDSKQMEVFRAALGLPLPLCYGKLRAVGNLLLLYQKADKTRIAFYGLGEGEWDGIDRLWVNRKLVDHTDTTKYHFHPGLDGILAGIDTPGNSGAVRASNVVTIKTLVAHGFLAGASVLIAGVTDGSFNGTFPVATVPDSTHLTYAQVAGDATSGNGTVSGNGLTPSSNGGDQRVDNFYTDLPPWVLRVTFSRKAYLAVKVAEDVGAPTSDLEVLADYRTTKVRIFNGSGTETSYAYTTNPAWQILDILLRTKIKREALIDAALTTEEKTRINFQSFVDAAADYDYDIGGGVKRVEVNVAFPREVSLTAALEQMLLMSRSYLLESAGQIQLKMDKARASTFILTSDHYVPGSLKIDEDYIDSEPNRYVYQFNDLDVPKIAKVDTPANSGAVRSANVVTIKTVDDAGAAMNHGLLVGMSFRYLGCDNSSFDGLFLVKTVPTSSTLTYDQTGSNATSGNGTISQEEQRFLTRTPAPIGHVQHQLAMGQRGVGLAEQPKQTKGEFDMGNNTAERSARLLSNLLIRNLGPDVTPYIAPKQGTLLAWMESVDVNDKALIERLRGEVITIHRSVSEEFQGDYELLEMRLPTIGGEAQPDDEEEGAGAAGGRALELFLKGYVPEAFADTSPAQQVPTPPPRNLPVA